jgi:hypothetical protein
MTTTFASRLAGDAHNLRLYITIQGVPDVFQEDKVDVPTTIEASSRPRRKLVDSIEQSETRLNLATRRIEGGSLTIRLQDDDAGTLVALFAPRSYRKSYCTASHTKLTGTLTVKGTGWAPAAGTVYVGSETITYTGKTATTLTGCTRGGFNSEAQAHYGASDVGEDVFTTPPSWAGRRVYLTGYFVNDDGSTTAALSQSLGVFRISEAPQALGDDIWEIQCTDLVEEFGNKKLGGGLRTVAVDGTSQRPAVDFTTGLLDIVVNDAADYSLFNIGGTQTHVLATFGDGSPLIWPLDAVDGAGTISVKWDGQLVLGEIGSDGLSGSGADLLSHQQIESVRHIAVLLMDPATTALTLITSRLGEGSNGAYDTLPGLDQSSFGAPVVAHGRGHLAERGRHHGPAKRRGRLGRVELRPRRGGRAR